MSIGDTWERHQLRDAVASDVCTPKQLHAVLDEEIEKRKKQKEALKKARGASRTGVLKPMAVQVWHPPGRSSYAIMILTGEYTHRLDLWSSDKLEDFVTLDEE